MQAHGIALKAETISDAWFDTDNKENICYLNSSSLWLEQQVGYFSAGDMAYMMVGLGRGSDPTTKGDENNYCSSAMYVYRNMMSMDFGGAESYYPAAKIISKNAFGCDIALRVVGGLQVHGGVMEKGYSMEYTASGNVNVLDLSNGTTLLLYTSIAPKTEGHTKTYQSFFFPTLTKLRYQAWHLGHRYLFLSKGRDNSEKGHAGLYGMYTERHKWCNGCRSWNTG